MWVKMEFFQVVLQQNGSLCSVQGLPDYVYQVAGGAPGGWKQTGPHLRSSSGLYPVQPLHQDVVRQALHPGLRFHVQGNEKKMI